MTSDVPPAAPASRPSLRQRRCVRHSAREAVVRCPACGGFFCRECVAEHEGQWLCAACMARKAAATAGARPRRWPGRLTKVAGCAASLLAAWLLFYAVGYILVRVPPDVHEGTFWRKKAGASDEPAP